MQFSILGGLSLLAQIPVWIVKCQIRAINKHLLYTTKQDGQVNMEPTVIANDRREDRFPERKHHFTFTSQGIEHHAGFTIPKGWQLGETRPAPGNVILRFHPAPPMQTLLLELTEISENNVQVFPWINPDTFFEVFAKQMEATSVVLRAGRTGIAHHIAWWGLIDKTALRAMDRYWKELRVRLEVASI